MFDNEESSYKDLGTKEGQHYNFEYEGKQYVCYRRTYEDGTQDVEVFLAENEAEDVSGEVFDYAEQYLDSLEVTTDLDLNFERGDKGNALIGSIVALLIMGIATLALLQLMGQAQLQQASIQRKVLWGQARANLWTVLRSQAACDATVRQFRQLTPNPVATQMLLANGATFLEEQQSLGFGLRVTRLTIASLGTATASTRLVTLEQRGASDNYQMLAVSSDYKVQQAIVDVQAGSGRQLWSTVFYVNVVLNASGEVVGCSL